LKGKHEVPATTITYIDIETPAQSAGKTTTIIIIITKAANFSEGEVNMVENRGKIGGKSGIPSKRPCLWPRSQSLSE